MATIGESAKYVRSKGAGPFWMTIDIFCDSEDSFARFQNSQTISPKTFGDIFQVPEENVKIFFLPQLNVIKISVPRIPPQGHREERDLHCGQQYVRILDVTLS